MADIIENNNTEKLDLYKSPEEQINEIETHYKNGEENSNKVKEKYETLGKISDLSKKIGNNAEIKITNNSAEIILQNYDVKVAMSPKKGLYFLQINGNNLDIEINSQEKLDKIISAIEKGILAKTNDLFEGKIKNLTGLGDNSLKLNGDLISRKIKLNDSLLFDYFDEDLINNKESKLSKNEIEEIFVFIMNIKGIKKEDWQIESTICRNNTITPECKNELGIPDINPNDY